MRRYFKTGGRVGFSRAGPVGNLPWVRGTSRPGVKKAPRGAEHREAIRQEQGPKVVKGTRIRKEYADLKRAHHTKQRILKARAGRQQAAKVAAGTAKLQAKHPSFKGLAARSKYPKTFRRKGIT